MKTLKLFLVLIITTLFIACVKPSVEPTICINCTDVEETYLNGKLLESKSYSSYILTVPDTDTLKTINNTTGIITLRYLKCN